MPLSSQLCAQYFLGGFFSCPTFYARSEFANAPYICLVEIQNFLGSNLNISTVKTLSNFLNYNGSLTGITISPTVLVDYLTSPMQTNCERRFFLFPLLFDFISFFNGKSNENVWNVGCRCYQRYISQANDLFQGSCRNELLNPANTANYPFLKFFSQYQMFRNQICGKHNPNRISILAMDFLSIH